MKGKGNQVAKKDVKGLKELHLMYNNLGSFFMKCLLDALNHDDYLRVIDLRKNKLSKKIVKDEQLDLIGSLRRNESLTNIDFRNNDCFDRQLKFQLSLIMIRNIDKLRSEGTMVQGSWLNKNVLMLE